MKQQKITAPEFVPPPYYAKLDAECSHSKAAPKETLNNLPISQAGPARHKCAVCAYHEGRMMGWKEGIEYALRHFKQASIDIKTLQDKLQEGGADE